MISVSDCGRFHPWEVTTTIGWKRPQSDADIILPKKYHMQKMKGSSMARIEKYSSGYIGVIKHNIREFKDGICPTNMEVDSKKSGENYSIIHRGNTAKEIDKYRRKIEKECFHFNRKNLVHVNEVICTLPADCPPEQEKQFFEESFRYICSTLPMGEKCVILAEVHCDEGHITKDGITIVQGQKHLHVMYVPAVKDTKHEGYDYKLCSDALTRRSILKQWHPNYQKWLDDAGVHATVASGVTSGKGISVKSLKEISKETGLSLDQIHSLEKENKKLYRKLMDKERELIDSKQTILNKEKENQHIKATAQKIISAKEIELQSIQEKLAEKEEELNQAKNKIHNLESKQKTSEISHTDEHTWGNNSNWGTNTSWGHSDNNSNQHTYEEDKLW